MTLNLLVTLFAALAPIAQNTVSRLPDGVEATLTVRIVDHRSTFYMGEIIPLELEFRGQGPVDYYFSTEAYDRSGRMVSEQYLVSPVESVRDPLADYYSAGMGAIGGGIRGTHRLDGRPFQLRVTLNEWTTFTRPGRYELSVSSTRLRRGMEGPVAVLRSNAVAFEIEPAPSGWPDAQLARAVGLLQSGFREEIKEGATILRHLGTRDAALVLVASYETLPDEVRFEVLAGLVGSPFRADVVSAMEARLDEGAPMPPAFFRDLTLLRSLLEMAPGAQSGRDLSARLREFESGYQLRWLARLDTSPAAAAAMLQTMASDDTFVQAAAAARLNASPADASAALLALPPSALAGFLYAPKSLLDPAWLAPALEILVERSSGDRRARDVGGEALTALLDVDSARGASLLLDELRTGRRGLGHATLIALAGTRPDGVDDAVLRQRVEQTKWGDPRTTTLWLIAMYGSSELAPLVKDVLRPGLSCAPEAAVLVFLLKHDPEAALHRLAPGHDRTGSCVTPPWELMAPYYWDARLEDAAIAHMRHDGPETAGDAIRVLGQHGSIAVKEAMLRRLEALAIEWRGLADEVKESPLSPPTGIESALLNALFRNPRMTLSPADISRVRAACVTDYCRRAVERR